MWISRFQNFIQKLKASSIGQYLVLVLVLGVLFWGFMAADGANVSFVYNNF